MLNISSSADVITVKLSDVAAINPRLAAKPAADEMVAFVPMSALSAETAGIIAEESRLYTAVARGYISF